MELRDRIERAIEKAGLSEYFLICESKSTDSIYINSMFNDCEIRISDHTKKNMFGEVEDLDIAEEIISASCSLAEELEREAVNPSEIETLKIEFEKIANSINAKRENLKKAREKAAEKREKERLLAIEQARQILNSNSPELDSFRRKNGLLIIGRELSFYSFLKKKGIKITKKEAYRLYREAIWEQDK